MKQLPQSKPILAFDGDCGFCRYWILRWKHHTEHRVQYEPYQDVSLHFKDIPIEDFQKSVVLILPDGSTFRGAEAVFRTLAQSPSKQWPLWLYTHVPGVRSVSEFFYGMVARHRVFFSKLTRWIWGYEIGKTDFFLARSLFLKSLAVIYFIAFASIGVQILGLIGSDGIAPAGAYLDAIANQYGPERFRLLPSVFWFNASDTLLQAVCWAGAVVSVLLFIGWAPFLCLFVLWALYLSILSVGNVFLSFQWDILLVEVGFLAIFLAPLQFKPKIAREAAPSKLVLFLLSLLLFRLMFSSGLVKLISQDPTWANLTALEYHYETQPLPTWTAWFMHQLPAWVQKISVGWMFLVELFFPFLIFAPRRLRYLGALIQISLQIIILATGNYCFFNLLTLALCFLLFDDTAWPKFMRKRLEEKRNWSKEFPSNPWPGFLIYPTAALLLFMTAVTWPTRMGVKISWPSFVMSPARFFAPFRLVNNYGLFAVMTTKRPEILVEGSMDGQIWKTYEFKYKPGDLKHRPRFVAPHQPRLDWQMWFAALGKVQQNPWFTQFCVRLLQGSQSVLDLLKTNPFPDEPPRFIRASMYDYHFTDFKTKEQTNQWWRRDNKRSYLPTVRLR